MRKADPAAPGDRDNLLSGVELVPAPHSAGARGA